MLFLFFLNLNINNLESVKAASEIYSPIPGIVVQKVFSLLIFYANNVFQSRIILFFSVAKKRFSFIIDMMIQIHGCKLLLKHLKLLKIENFF